MNIFTCIVRKNESSYKYAIDLDIDARRVPIVHLAYERIDRWCTSYERRLALPSNVLTQCTHKAIHHGVMKTCFFKWIELLSRELWHAHGLSEVGMVKLLRLLETSVLIRARI